MCRICGITDELKSIKINDKLIDDMLTGIYYRVPDDYGIFQRSEGDTC